MTDQRAGASTRTSKVIAAGAEEIYDAFVDPVALLEWLPPGRMTGTMHAFESRVGGGYEMSLFYPPDEQTFRGKTAANEDRVAVRFVELSRPRRIVEAVRFATGDPALGGEITLTITFDDVAGGTEVTMLFENLPLGLRPEDNEEGARLSLEQLAQRSEIIALEARIRLAQLNADVAELDALISDNLLFTGPDGQLGTKAQDLEAHRSGVVRFRAHEPEELRVRRVGADVAVAALRARLVVDVAGTVAEGTYRYTRVWAREDGRGWRVVGGHVSEVGQRG